MKTTLAVLLIPLASFASASPFEGADEAAGQALHSDKCVACHESKYSGEEGSAIYLRPDRRVNTVSQLKTQLTACTTQLSLDLFPEDEDNIGAYLNNHYYHFEAP
jgi:mono/diheme cytochrome c family protein